MDGNAVSISFALNRVNEATRLPTNGKEPATTTFPHKHTSHSVDTLSFLLT